MGPLRNFFLAVKWIVALAFIRAGLSLFSLAKTQALLNWAGTFFPRKKAELYQLVHSLDTIDAMGHTLLGDKACLTQALAARWLLRRHGLPANLVIGVAKKDAGTQQLNAHAWVECEEHIVMGGADSPEKFTVLPSVEEYL